MKATLSILLISFSMASCFVPLKLRFNGNQQPILKSVEQCEGHDSDALQVVGGSTPPEICMPGSMELDVQTKILEDLPTDLMMDLELKKLTPFPMDVPCLDGIGSCTYDLCPMIDANQDLCAAFPESQPCGCPLLAGEMNLSGVSLPVQDMGPILGAVMEGEYDATMSLYGASAPDVSVGCVKFHFALKQC